MGEKPVLSYPSHRPKPDRSGRRWRVQYNLAYDGGGGEWTGFYRTLWGARLAVWWNRHVSSWGGTARIFDSRESA